MAEFPDNLLQRYKKATSQLRKFHGLVLRRFTLNIAELSEEFNLLAIQFQSACLPQYAALCWYGAAKCEKALAINHMHEVDYLLKAARAFVRANQTTDKLKLKSNWCEYLEGALKCYNKAVVKLADDSVMKAAIIREIKQINPSCEQTSSFASSSHRIYDLEMAIIDNINNGDYVGALDKYTDIFDDISERKVEDLYEDILRRNEISRILLLLLLELPPAKQAPSNVQLLDKYVINEMSIGQKLDGKINRRLPDDIFLTIQHLVICWKTKDWSNIMEAINRLTNFKTITKEQHIILHQLRKKYRNREININNLH